MRVTSRLTDEEVRAALREWLTNHGVPAIAVESMTIHGQVGRHSSMQVMERVQVVVEFEVDSVALEGEVRARGEGRGG